MRYYEYINNWRLEINETLCTKTKPKNIMYKFPVAVINNGSITGHLINGRTVKFLKLYFFLTSRQSES